MVGNYFIIMLYYVFISQQWANNLGKVLTYQ